jgi:hypothetical protein
MTRFPSFTCAIGLFLLLFTGCATPDGVGHHTFLNQPLPAKPKDYPIDVYLQELPTRPFERVATLDAHCESQFFAPPSVEIDAVPELKRQARLAGCDAIIEISETKPAKENWTLETRTLHVTATGIVYK